MNKILRHALVIGGLAVGTAAAAEKPAPTLSGAAFFDRNGNGQRDDGELGVAGARISDQRRTVLSSSDGRWTIPESRGHGVVFVGAPAGYRSAGPFWAKVAATPAPDRIDFALTQAPIPRVFSFLHGSDCHVSPASLARLQAVQALVEARRPAFVLMTGDLVRDALRVSEQEARGYYDLYLGEIARFPVPVWSVPGNHEIFGIERHVSLVSPSHPLYGKKMYRDLLGPNYYSFDFGGVHFVALDTVDVDDLWYYGHVDAAQLEWLEGDLATVPPGTPVVTFNHIPLVSAVEILGGYRGEPPAPTLITVGGKAQFRHSVSNPGDVITRLKHHRYVMALGGHMHTRETLRYEADGLPTRFHQGAAIVAPNEVGPLRMTSGVTLYRVEDGQIDDGTFLPLDGKP